ncbi:MAG: hypothetical protein LQ340_000695 [Diploschistes diacapsis]|nr:MAG: hypothetical protein LQ340_000695 [Diploschistes diacapsis]
MAKEELENMEPPTSIDPYATLNVGLTATAEEVRGAYRKLALRLHPDKAAPDDRNKAHRAFQDLAFAYAILSDERRRKRYDATGNTSETLDLDDDDFNWGDFFRTQYSELVTAEKISDFEKTYKKSEEERLDVLKAYRQRKGNMNGVFNDVMLSNPLDDEDRFREYIDRAVEGGEVEAFKAYAEESDRSRQARMKKAQKERTEAEDHVKEMGPSARGKKEGGKKIKGKTEDIGDLALMIQQRNGQRRDNFLEGLLDKYGGKGKKKRGAPPDLDEPSEEAFAEMGRRKKQRTTKKDQDEAAEHEGGGPIKRSKSPRTRNARKAKA